VGRIMQRLDHGRRLTTTCWLGSPAVGMRYENNVTLWYATGGATHWSPLHGPTSSASNFSWRPIPSAHSVPPNGGQSSETQQIRRQIFSHKCFRAQPPRRNGAASVLKANQKQNSRTDLKPQAPPLADSALGLPTISNPRYESMARPATGQQPLAGTSGRDMERGPETRKENKGGKKRLK
jgi:hypothetical protein